MAQAPGELLVHLTCKPPITLTIPVITISRRSCVLLAGVIGEHDVGILRCHPDRRSAGGRADNYIDSVSTSEIDCPFQPVQIVLAFLRLKRCPSELAHTYEM